MGTLRRDQDGEYSTVLVSGNALPSWLTGLCLSLKERRLTGSEGEGLPSMRETEVCEVHRSVVWLTKSHR